MAELVELDDVKTYLKITGGAEDDRLNLIISLVTGLIQDFTHRQLVERVDFEERHHGRNTPLLFPFDAPITGVTTLDIIDPDGDVILDSLTLNEDFVISPSKEYLQLRNALDRRGITGTFAQRFPAGEANLKLIYTSGFAAIPKGVQMAAFEAVSFFRSKSSAGLKSERLGDYSYTTDTPSDAAASGIQLPATSRGALRRWVRPRIRFAGRPLTPDTGAHRISQLNP